MINIKVKLFDEEDELDLEEDVNDFLDSVNCNIVDIKYQVSTSIYADEQIYCFSAMIIYMSND